MNPIAVGLTFAGALVVGMAALMEIGRWLGQRRALTAKAADEEEHARAGLGAIEGSVFALLGLLIAFTFTGAAGRFDHRRELVMQEVNDIGTAWLRLDLVQPSARAALQADFRQYLDHRLEAYQLAHDPERAFAELARADEVQQRIWAQAIAAAEAEPGKPIIQVLLPALNAMFDTASLRTMTLRVHPPVILFIMLGGCALVAALMAGYGMSPGRRSWTHIIVFAVIMSGSVYIIVDMEFPRLGLIRVDSFDQNLVDLRRSMAPAPGG